MQGKLLGIISLNFDVTDQVLIIYSSFVKYVLGRPREHNKAVHQLFIDFKRTYDPFRREVLYNILTEFVIPMKLARPIKMCLNETGSRIRVGKHLFDIFQIKNGLKKEMPCRHYLLTLLWGKPLGGVQVDKEDLKFKMVRISF